VPRQTILTPEVLTSIPALVEQGFSKAEIAERLGCKASSLQVRCSIAGISLRRVKGKRIQLHDGSQLALSPEALAGLKTHAASIGCSAFQLVSKLLEMIERDNLYNAVLDFAPLQPEQMPSQFAQAEA
jgi:hypothetical protein